MERLSLLLEAIEQGQDEETERLCQGLTVDDVDALIQLATAHQASAYQACAQQSVDNSDAEDSDAEDSDAEDSDAATHNETRYTIDAERYWWAIRGLAICGDARAMALLRGALTADDAEVRSASVLALGHIGERIPSITEQDGLLEEMAHLLGDAHGYVRQASADALAFIGNPAIGVLHSVLMNAPQGSRVRAAYALRKIGTMEAAPALFSILNDANYLVHTYAHEALEDMGLLDNVLVTLNP